MKIKSIKTEHRTRLGGLPSPRLFKFLTFLAALGFNDPISQAQQNTPAPPAPTTTETADAASSLTETVVEATAPAPLERQTYTNVQSQVLRPSAPATTTAQFAPVISTLEPVANVVGLPGSGYFVTAEEIRQQNYVNVNRVLARVPGVYVREEDGAGLFPNISIRGADGTRSEKTTVMEDGILTAPATYSAPSAYYSPNIARMAGIEILKGSSQVRFGPHTTGGVINYLSTPIPENEQFYLRSTYGSFNTKQTHVHYGDTIETAVGNIGYLAELHYKDSSGFRDIVGGPAIPGGGDTGYTNIEPMIKLSYEPNTLINQRFEFKYGMSDLDANETYLGLTEADARINPYHRYAGSYLDNITTEQHRTYLKHSIEFNDSWDLEMAAYYNQFERDWFKINAVNGTQLHRILANPAGNALNFARLTGQAAGTLNYTHNARSYESYGFQAETNYEIEGSTVDHLITAGIRRHKDSIQRFQENTNVVTSIGNAPVINNLGPGTGGNRYEETYATSYWIQDALNFGALTVTPGIRYEHLDQRDVLYQSNATYTPTRSLRGSTGMVAPGIGFNYEVDEINSVYGGVFRGIAAPGPSSHLPNDVDWERSTGYEFGFRHAGENFNSEIGGFYTDFQNLIGQSAGLGLGTGVTQNAGEAEVYGIEYLASYDPWRDRSLRLPLFFSATWTSAHLAGDPLKAGGGENIYGDGNGGPGIADAELPYIPEWKLAMGAGLETDQWGLNLNATYITDTFGTALNSPIPVTSSRQGIVDGGFIVDLGGFYEISDRVNMIGGIHNLFDNTMITSRIPDGPRNGAPRSAYVGVEILWEPKLANPSN